MRRSSFRRVRSLVVIAAASVLLLAGVARAQGVPQSVAGKYSGTASSPTGDLPVNCDLKVADGKLAVTIESPQGTIAITGGSFTGDKLVLNIDMGGQAGTISGTLANGKVTGQWSLGEMSGTCVLTKDAADTAKPAAGGADKPTPATADAISGVWDGVAGSDQASGPFVLTLK